MISDEEVQETFYNAMVDTMLTGIINGFNPEFIKNTLLDPNSRPEFIKEIVAETFVNVLKSSKITQMSDGNISIEILSSRGKHITQNNVSPVYKNLFSALIVQFQTKSPEMLMSVASSTTQLESFKIMINRVIKFYFDTKKTETCDIPITLDAIRDTFYNIMVEQYFVNNLISREDLESCESHIFIALSAYVIFEIATKQKLINGIKLCNDTIVTLENCPALYKPLFEILLEIKKLANRINLTPDEEKYILCTVSLKQESENVPNVVRTEIKHITSKISDIAIQISQMTHFKNVIGNVINFLLEIGKQ